jgi:hypothetical protein
MSGFESYPVLYKDTLGLGLVLVLRIVLVLGVVLLLGIVLLLMFGGGLIIPLISSVTLGSNLYPNSNFNPTPNR